MRGCCRDLNQATRVEADREALLGSAGAHELGMLEPAGLELESVRIVPDCLGDLVVGHGLEPRPVRQALLKPLAQTHSGKLVAHGAALSVRLISRNLSPRRVKTTVISEPTHLPMSEVTRLAMMVLG